MGDRCCVFLVWKIERTANHVNLRDVSKRTRPVIRSVVWDHDQADLFVFVLAQSTCKCGGLGMVWARCTLVGLWAVVVILERGLLFRNHDTQFVNCSS